MAHGKATWSFDRRRLLKVVPQSVAGWILASSFQAEAGQAAKKASALRLSTYFMAEEFERYLKTEQAIDEVIRVCKGYGIPRIYLETFRGGFQPDRAVIAHARDRLRAADFEVAGAICTINYGVPANVMRDFACLTHEQSQQALAKMFQFAASLFDTILIDEYIWSHCTCDRCQAAKGERTWTEFRCAQLRQVCRDFVVGPARKVNSKVRLIYKFPAMYEELAHQGQDIDFMLQDFDAIWIGTEIGPFIESPQNMLRSQGPYRAFFYARWMLAMGGEKTGGSWIMPLADSGHLLDTAYQTILAGAPELVLHPYGGLSPDYHWALRTGKGEFPKLLADLSELDKLAAIVRENTPRGLVAARPARAEPWDFGKAYDANVFDYVGQLGIPLLPRRDLPDQAEGYFLSLHARSLPDYEKKIQSLRNTAVPILVTDGLASLLDLEFLNRPNVQVIEASVPEPTVYDYRAFGDPYDMAMRLRPVPRDKAWAALADDTGWDVSLRYAADTQMAAKIFSITLGVPDLPRQLGPRPFRTRIQRKGSTTIFGSIFLESLREQLLKPFGLSLRGPLLVSLHPLGKEFIALHNFNDHAVTMWLKSDVGSSLEPVVTLPGTARTRVWQDKGGFSVEIEAHTLTCLRITA